ncbi:DUF3089 domain-containing protein [Maricaulaceae bacterium EIL42A08]|nr:DUF3089 domain-containing protein [Maricaulaceae bacterium EIL42A08]
MSEIATSPKPRNWLKTLLLAGAGGFMILLLVAGVVLRDQIYQSFLDPGIPFQTYERPDAPDYANTEAWAARPETVPDEDVALDALPAAVFFIHNTTYDGGAHWNAPFDRAQEAEEVERIVLPNWAAPFMVADTQLYAPRYRQASLYSFMNNREDSISARLLAFEDVQAAFDAFVARTNPEQPIILVGLDQGALHGLGLLLTRFSQDNALRARLVAAYLLEAPVPMDLFATGLANLAPCQNAEDVRCVVSYSAARPEERERIFALTERSMSWTDVGDLRFVSDRALLCTNPLTWSTNGDYAPDRLHRGGAAAEGLELSDTPSAMANQTGAQCQNGVLMVDQPRANALRRAGRLGEDRRAPDFNLFYMDLAQNAATRLANLIEIRVEEARWAPPLEGFEEVEVAPLVPIDEPTDDG